jgi:hypothetical protein
VIGLAKSRLLRAMRRCHLIGGDTKHDFNVFHFPTFLVSFTDACNMGKIGSFFVLSVEDSAAVSLALRVTRWNVGCADEHCEHPSEVHCRHDGNGW